jgi:tRNA(Ile)-lysidine synthetase-like protein
MQVLKTLPSHIGVAVSGGLDSLVALHWLNQRRDVVAVHYIHDSEFADTEHEFVQNFCSEFNIVLITAKQTPTSQAGLSREEYWRNGRYEFFRGIPMPVCTGHNLDDAVEWYLFTSLHGQGHYMEYSHANVVRPFLTTKKSEFRAHADKYVLKWLEDESNSDVDFAVRNRIRHDILPLALQVNPGLFNMVKRRIAERILTQ